MARPDLTQNSVKAEMLAHIAICTDNSIPFTYQHFFVCSGPSAVVQTIGADLTAWLVARGGGFDTSLIGCWKGVISAAKRNLNMDSQPFPSVVFPRVALTVASGDGDPLRVAADTYRKFGPHCIQMFLHSPGTPLELGDVIFTGQIRDDGFVFKRGLFDITGVTEVELYDKPFPFIKWNDPSGMRKLSGVYGEYGGKDTVSSSGNSISCNEIPILYGDWTTPSARFQVPIYAFIPNVVMVNESPYGAKSMNYINLSLGWSFPTVGMDHGISIPMRVQRITSGRSGMSQGGQGTTTTATFIDQWINLLSIPQIPTSVKGGMNGANLYYSYLAFLGDSVAGQPSPNYFPLYKKDDTFYVESAIGVEPEIGDPVNILRDILYRGRCADFIGSTIFAPAVGITSYKIRGWLSGSTKGKLISDICSGLCSEVGLIMYIDSLGAVQVMKSPIYNEAECAKNTQSAIAVPSSTSPYVLSPLNCAPEKYTLSANPPKWGNKAIWVKYQYSPRSGDYLSNYSPSGMEPPTDNNDSIIECKWIYRNSDAIDYWNRVHFVQSGNARLLEVDTSHKQLSIGIGEIVEWSGDDVLSCRQMVISCDDDYFAFAKTLRGVEIVQVLGTEWGANSNLQKWDDPDSQWG